MASSKTSCQASASFGNPTSFPKGTTSNRFENRQNIRGEQLKRSRVLMLVWKQTTFRRYRVNLGTKTLNLWFIEESTRKTVAIKEHTTTPPHAAHLLEETRITNDFNRFSSSFCIPLQPSTAGELGEDI